jgi:hypothetical protein
MIKQEINRLKRIINEHPKVMVVCLLIGFILMILRLLLTHAELSSSYLHIEMNSFMDDTAKVYYDLGQGLSENDSQAMKVIGDQRFHVYKFMIPQGVTRPIRFDPLTNQGSVTIKKMELLTGFGKRLGAVNLRHLQPANQIRKLEIHDDEAIIITDEKASDPQVYAVLEQPASSGYISSTFFFFILRMVLEFIVFSCFGLGFCLVWVSFSRLGWQLRVMICASWVVAGCLSYYNITTISRDVRNIINLGKYILSTTEEQRKEVKYQQYGYGYIRDVVMHLPEPDIFPNTRYPDFTKHVHLLSTENRKKIDERILIGIGLAKEDHESQPILTQVTHFKTIRQEQQERSFWFFYTGSDYDEMTGIALRLNDKFPTDQTSLLNIKVYLSMESDTPLREFSIMLDQRRGDYRVVHLLSDSIKQFSFSRGATAFKLEIDALAPICSYIEKIEVLAIKVNLLNYTVIHRAENGFTALRNDFINEIKQKNLSSWYDFMERLSNGI